MTTNASLLTPTAIEHLKVIYSAYDRIYDIASHRWQAAGHYSTLSRTSDLFGHYVRTLPRFSDHDPAYITCQQYGEYAQPLIDAFNHILPLILVDNLKSSDIRMICAGTAPLFYHDTPYERCMAAFRLVEKVYPRADYIAGAKPKKRRTTRKRTHDSRLTTHASYNRPHRTSTWTPYKD